MAPFHIKPLGIQACGFCPAIAEDAHTPACEVNKKARADFMMRKNKKTAALDSVAQGRPPRPPRPAVVAQMDLSDTA